jgi:hypothetical protein
MSEADPALEVVEARASRLREFQGHYGAEASDLQTQAPAAALLSLENAVAAAPPSYRNYLEESLTCYASGLYRASILMTWSATVAHLHHRVHERSGGVKAIEAANVARYGSAKGYRRIRKVDDLLYLRESQVVQLGEDAGMYNRNARKLLLERLELRNLCGHPTGYVPGREETVIFAESLILNILGGAMLNW